MVRVAAAQVLISHKTKENLTKILLFIKKASLRNARLVCFPETSLCKSKNKQTLGKIPIISYTEEIQKQCKKYKIYCIFGTNILERNSVYNSAFVISNKGKILYHYKKNYLFRNERKHVVAGRKNKVVKTSFGKIGILICWDLVNASSVRKLAQNGAWIILCPSYIKIYGRELESYLHIPYVRAFEASSYIVSVDSANNECARLSCVCSPSTITKLENKEGLLIVDLNKRKIMHTRKYYGLP